ncbi:MAG: hypothetical protein E6128_08110, partial [Cutibacterium avidum]|nr:hypothetical protein [Cutibacterium avidum]MDU5420018.1 hypothetical protein [Cutibacterium avidum]
WHDVTGQLRADHRDARPGRRVAASPPRSGGNRIDLLTDQDDDTTLILRDWAYDGTGWDTTTDEALALAAAARAREYDQWKAARKNTHPHPKEN